MALENVSADELSIAINRVGAGEAAKLGYFHALPYGEGGGSGSYGGKMFKAPVESAPGPPGFYIAQFDIGDWIPPLAYVPFTRSVVLNPVADYNYTLNEFVAPDLRTVLVSLIIEWTGGGVDPGTGVVGVFIGLKVEPFDLS